MKKLCWISWSLAVASAAFALTQCRAPLVSRAVDARGVPVETSAQRDERMAWWREARFGMFVHWGLYSIPAGRWGADAGHGEWIRETAHIPLDEYERLQPRFDPVNFDARAWASLAKRAGMRYVVITSKHHDGFGLWDSAQSTWDMDGTPSKRDLLGELKAACDAEGLRFCTYHSIMDWHHPDYLPRRAWETRSAEGAQFPRFVRYLHAQVAELVTRYQPAVMWFDGEWESTWSHELGVELYAHCRKLDPQMIVNNRVDVHRGGMAGFSQSSEAVGDFGTPEQEVPAQGLPGVDWETCMTMNEHWGFCAADTNWKSLRTCIRTLVDVASKGGNFLFNVGPLADGTFPPEAVERLEGIARWMEANGAAIHGTQASPLGPLAFGRCTMGSFAGGTRLFLCVYDWPANGELVVPGIGNRATFSQVWGNAIACRVERRGDSLVVHVPPTAPDPDVSVVVLDLEGAPIVYQAPGIRFSSLLVVGETRVELQAPTGLEVRYTLDGSEPLGTSTLYTQPLVLSQSTHLQARSFHAGRPVSAIAGADFVAVEPRAGSAEPLVAQQGVRYLVKEGDFDRIPDLPASVPVQIQGDLRDGTGFSLPPELRREHVAAVLYAQMYVPRTGVWVFELSSDDGSKLWIDGAAAIDHDGLHGTSGKLGEVALAQGWHEVRVEWFNKSGGAELRLTRAVAGEPQQAIPSEHLRASLPRVARY